jgi:hypothetical protein
VALCGTLVETLFNALLSFLHTPSSSRRAADVKARMMAAKKKNETSRLHSVFCMVLAPTVSAGRAVNGRSVREWQCPEGQCGKGSVPKISRKKSNF